MKPIVDGLEKQYGDQITVRRVKADEGDGPAVMRAYQIRGHPTILILDRQGWEVNRLIGPQSPEKLSEVVQQALTLAAGQDGSIGRSTSIPPLPTLDATEVALGRRIYLEQCAVCHGQNGEGQPDWKRPDANGNLPAPPHDDSGHTWHHGDGLLYQIIRDGFRDPLKPPDSPLTMPAFGHKLSEAEIRALITYFKTLWSTQSRQFQWEVTQQQPLPALPPSNK